jgi:hypothetical protein
MRAPTGPGPLEATIFDEALRSRPAFFVALALVVHAALWTMVPWLADPTPHPKIAIGLALGHEWQIGYAGTPPLAPWLLEIVYRATGRIAATHFLAPFSVALAGWFVFALARRIVGDRQGALATFLMVAIFPVAFPVGPFDSNLVQMPLIAGAVLAWWRVVREQSLPAWFGLTFALVALAYAGLQGLFVFATLAGLTLASENGRSAFRPQEMLLAALLAFCTFLLLLTPRLLWLTDHGFAGLMQGPDAGVEPGAQVDALGLAFGALAGHIGLLLLVVLAAPIRIAKRETASALVRPPLDRFVWTTVIVLALLPALFAWTTAAFTGGRFQVGAAAPLLLYSGLLVVVLAPAVLHVHHQRAVAFAAMTLLFLPPVFEVASAYAAPWIGEGGRATNWPAEAAGRYVKEVFRTRTGKPLEFVIGDARTAGAIALARGARPHVFLDADPTRSPWIDQEKLKAAGAVVVWPIEGENASPPFMLTANLPTLTPEAPLSFNWVRPGRLDPVRLGWAIIPPAR